jgi:hypothetical protein
MEQIVFDACANSILNREGAHLAGIGELLYASKELAG